MGNKSNVEVNMNELSTIRGAERFLDAKNSQEVLQPVYCCCFRVGRRSYELWRKNLENNFTDLETTVVWIKYLRMVYKNNQHSREDDLQELYHMRTDWEEKSESIQDLTKYTQLIQKSIVVGSTMSRKQKTRKSISLKQRNSAARSIILTRSSRSPVKPFQRESCKQNIGELFSNKKYYFDKETADSMYLFTLFCEIIQKHFKMADTLFYRMKDTFIDYVANNNNDIQSLISNIHQYIRLTWETVVDYYRVEDLDLISGANSFFTQQNLETLITSILFRNSIIHGHIFQCFVSLNIAKEKELQATISRLRDATPQSLQIKSPYCLTQTTVKWLQQNHGYAGDSPQSMIEQPYHSCILKMRQLQDTRTPAGKLKLLVATADLIINCINGFYQKRGMQTKMQALDADQILCIYSYILVRSRVKNLNAHLDIIEMFSSQGQLLSQTGYYFSVVSTALQGLENVIL